MPPTDAPTPSEVKRKRTRTGCLVCRKRKTRCDEERNLVANGTYACGRCVKSGKECLWPIETPAEARFAPYPAPKAPSSSSSSETPAPALAPQPEPSVPVAPPPTPVVPQDWLSSTLSITVPSPGAPLHTNTLFNPIGTPWPDWSQAGQQPPSLSPSFPIFDDLPAWSDPAPIQPLPHNLTQTAGGAGILLPFELLELIGSQPQSQDWTHQLPVLSLHNERAISSALETLYPDFHERQLIQHFLLIVPNVFSRPPRASLDGQRGETSSSPFVDLSVETFFPYLDVPQFLASSRGSSTASESLSKAMQAIGTIHLQHLHQGWSASYGSSSAPSSPCKLSVRSDDQYGQLSTSLLQASLSLGQASLLLSQLSNQATPYNQREDLSHLLAACSLAMIAQCMAGRTDYQPVFDLAMQVIRALGGPAAMLEAEATDSPSALLFQMSARRCSTKKRVRIVRAILEDLLGWDLLLCLTQMRRPALMAAMDGKAGMSGGSVNSWLFQYGPCEPQGTARVDTSAGDWETIQFTMGMSRTILDLSARVTNLCFAANSTVDVPPTLQNLSVDGLSNLMNASTSASVAAPPFQVRLAEDLLLEVRVRGRDVLLAHPDLELGGSGTVKTKASWMDFSTLLWTSAFEIILLVDCIKKDRWSDRIQTIALHIINLANERQARGVDEMDSSWPIVIAGSVLRAPHERAAVRKILTDTSFFFGFDMNQYFMALLEEVWVMHDAGNFNASWRDAPKAKAGVLLF